MKRILIILLLLLPLSVSAQSEEAEKLYNEGMNLYSAQEYEKAIPYLLQCFDLEKNNSQIKLLSTAILSRCYFFLGNYTEAIRYETPLLKELKNVYGGESSEYATSLNNLAFYYSLIYNYQKAITLGTQAVELRKIILGEENPNYANSLNSLSSYYAASGFYQEAIRLGTQVMEIRKKVFGEEHPDYANSLSKLAEYHAYLGNYQEAIRFCTQAMEIRKKVFGEENYDYAWSLNYLAEYNCYLNNYEETIKYVTQAMEIFKKVLGEEDSNYALELDILSNYYNQLGNNQEAIKLDKQALEIIKKVKGEENPFYVNVLIHLADYYADIDNYQEAIRLGNQTLEIQKTIIGEEHPDYARTLRNLANYNSGLYNYTKAVKFGEQALEIQKKVLNEEHPDYSSSLKELAKVYSHLGNYQEAIRLGTQAMEIDEKVLGKEHPYYATSLSNLSFFNFKLGNYHKAIELGTQAMKIYKKVFGEENPNYSAELYNLATYYFVIGKYEKANQLLKQFYTREEAFVMKTFAFLTNKERSEFWKKYSEFFNSRLTQVAYLQPNATLKSLALNGQLLSKGLLLNAELEIQNLIEQQGNEQMKEMYYQIRQNRKKLDELCQLSPDKRTMDADSLSKVIDNEERLLVESCKELGDYTKNLSIKWTDVQNNLTNTDIAIEFANFSEDDTTNQTIYIALVVKKGIKSPELVKLDFTDTDTADYSSPTLYNKIWQPLDKYLQGVENVYFSPAGKFHTIGIEYLSNDKGEIFAKQYNAYRLSSTREIALNHTINPNKKASVYGGINYNFDETDWQNVDENAERGGESLKFLKAAKVESEEITTILKDNSFDVEFGTGKAATEGSFKKLSGSGIKILHVATHGFYEPESKKNSFANMLSSGDEHSQEDRSLSRSGLFFAGANTFLNPEQRQFIPEGVDDGILTAKEISRMDFKGLDLVVLSACETGLGEVTGEGVFGLQRGFKKAGAQTIIMSLWKVNDKPAKEFMTEFYRNLMAGKSKREAFIAAQDKNRLKYIDPKMWAGFIMVDGVE